MTDLAVKFIKDLDKIMQSEDMPSYPTDTICAIMDSIEPATVSLSNGQYTFKLSVINYWDNCYILNWVSLKDTASNPENKKVWLEAVAENIRLSLANAAEFHENTPINERYVFRVETCSIIGDDTTKTDPPCAEGYKQYKVIEVNINGEIKVYSQISSGQETNPYFIILGRRTLAKNLDFMLGCLLYEDDGSFRQFLPQNLQEVSRLLITDLGRVLNNINTFPQPEEEGSGYIEIETDVVGSYNLEIRLRKLENYLISSEPVYAVTNISVFGADYEELPDDTEQIDVRYLPDIIQDSFLGAVRDTAKELILQFKAENPDSRTYLRETIDGSHATAIEVSSKALDQVAITFYFQQNEGNDQVIAPMVLTQSQLTLLAEKILTVMYKKRANYELTASLEPDLKQL
ncbi:hypothetical protein HYU06_05015 [Candidatus Woesearchaeota archaeon]|nr:hypothetical protein [Candidatus Woesearchaeota archaeon]